MAIASSLVQSCTSRLAGNLTTAAREMLPSGASIAALKVEAKGWYDTEPTSLKTDLVANFVSASSEYLSITNANQVGLDEESNFSMSCWVKATNTGVFQTIFSRWLSSGQLRGFFIVIDNNGKVGVYASDLGSNTLSSFGTESVDNTWQFITLTQDGVNSRVYVDGVLSASIAMSGVFSGAPIKFGVMDGQTNPINGQQTKGSFYSKVLSGAEMTAHYNSGVPMSYAQLSAAQKVNLVSYWDFSEPSGMRYDRHGTNNLTDNNTVGAAHGPVEYQADEYAGITKWVNQGTAASPFGNLTPITAGESPQLITGELAWDGLAKALLTPTGSVSQPLTKFLVITPSSFGGNDYLSSSYTAKNILRLLSTSLNMFSGASFSGAPNLVAATRYVIVAIFDGTSSRLIISGTETTGDAGTANGTGLAVGSSDGGAAPYRGGIEADLEFDRILTGPEIAVLTAAYS